jgi:hypothetical protein
MAKRIKKTLDLSPKFYVAYTNDKQIIAVTNFKDSAYSNITEVDFVCYDRFISGKDQFDNFRMGTVIDENGNSSLGVISHHLSLENSFKNKLLSWIEDSGSGTDISIVWDESNAHWMFNSSSNFKTRYFNNEIPASEILFFVILGNDPNFLIRIIRIRLIDLINNAVVKFNTTWEKTIEAISITSNLSELTYSLNIWKIDDTN